jgi:ubiquinone/menaquinone biosynthesis C-methylase UbiE
MTLVQSKVQRHYDEMAEVYDNRYDRKRGISYYNHISRSVMERIPKGVRLLDLGCGTGLFVRRYIASGGVVVGLDISRGMIEKAQARCRTSQFTLGNAEFLPFRENSFDAVSSLLAFSYLKKPEMMLDEVQRVLRPGGTVSVCTLGKNLLTRGLPAIYSIGEAMRIRHVGMGAFGEHYYSEREMEELFSSAGFENITVKRCSFAHINLADPLYDLAKKVEPFVEKRLPYLAYNICASGTKAE